MVSALHLHFWKFTRNLSLSEVVTFCCERPEMHLHQAPPGWGVFLHLSGC